MPLNHETMPKLLEDSQLSNQFFISSITLLVVYWLATLDTEIKYAWRSPWTYTKILFLLTRYPVFVERVFGVYNRTAHSIPMSWCPRLYVAMNSLSIFVAFFAELAMTIRVLALWKNNLYVKVLIYFMSIADITVAAVMVFLPASSVALPTTSGISSVPSVCFYVHHITIIMPYIVLVVHETFIFTLTVIKGVHHYRAGIHSSSLIMTLYYDGIMYYALAIIPSFTIIIMAFLKDNGTHISITANIQPVVLSILSSRLTLHLRHQAANQLQNTTVLVASHY